MDKICPVIISCILFTLFLSGCAHSDFEVSGIVKDKHNKGIPDAGLICSVCPYHTDTVKTDSLGRFKITVFEAGFKLRGKSHIYLFKEGYRSTHATVRMDRINQVKLSEKIFRTDH